MKLRYIFVLLGIALATPAQTQTAHDYFNELKAANAFRRYSDEYVCFRDDEVPSFAVMARGSTMIEHMKNAGLKPIKEILAYKDDVFVQSYYKGVSSGEGSFYTHVSKTGSEYEIEFNSPFHGRAVYSINWLTGRYRYLLYELAQSKTLPSAESSGKCDLIHPDVP
jgi:hypothetical protein